MASSETVRFLLVLGLGGMAILAVFSLRRRKLSTWAYLTWGALAVLLPLVGPFLVIYSRPGERKRPRRPSASTSKQV